jgi:hypothetical protein|tara:strand:- start:7399 stop:7902 length:504 start_codon:yes stop_codon:yes gene_type:complete
VNISNKSDFVASIILFLTGIIFYFIIIPQEIVLEDEAIIGPDLLPNICIILITFLSALLFLKSIKKEIKKENNNEETNTVYDNSMMLKVKSEFSLLEIKRVVLLSLSILISILLFTYVDVLIASIFLILSSCLVCGLKKIWIILSLSSGLLFLAYFLLYKVLGTAVG